MVEACGDPVAGNVFDKYGSRNPLIRRMVRGFEGAFLELAALSGAGRVHEVGCGEGHLSRLLAARGLEVRASDRSEPILDEARRRTRARGLAVEYRARSVYDLDPREDAADLVVCCEVLEHLPDPERALASLASVARPHLLVSVPREPWWRLMNLGRLRYVRRLGNTPGHLQHWTRRGFLTLLERHVEIAAVRSPWPWTMALARIPAGESRPPARTGP